MGIGALVLCSQKLAFYVHFLCLINTFRIWLGERSDRGEVIGSDTKREGLTEIKRF